MKKIIDLPPDDPARRFIDEQIDRLIVESLTPQRVFEVLQCALLRRGDDNEESKKLMHQVTLEIRRSLIPKNELKADADVEKWVELVYRRFNPLLTTAVRKELDAAVATGRLAHVGGGNYRVKPPSDRKLRCRTPRKRAAQD
jgi:hypothetical protein